MGCENSIAPTEKNQAAKDSKKETATVETKGNKDHYIKDNKDTVTVNKVSKTDSTVELKNVKSSALVRNVENDSKTDVKLEKPRKRSEWDMFADQDNFGSMDVSKVDLFALIPQIHICTKCIFTKPAGTMNFKG